ncbi:MAG: response regulator [Saprospiraceae bacterium]|nr:response regulator [Saprospiraceae bacterium]
MILIIEDNLEVRDYISHIFIGLYQVITSDNGEEGLLKARRHHPDLILSDVMMPVMDGVAMTKILKQDIEISHIPVILLTARSATLYKIEGLTLGADDYITKPFDPEELKLRVRNILRLRKEFRNKFARVLTFDPKSIEITSSDEEFLNKAMSITESNIENYEYSVDQFAYDLAISRPLLFIKLKALTDQTPNNFIKTIRLKRAAQLLLMNKLNVSEVAYKVGFKDPKYFRKCFQSQFDISPSDYPRSDQKV